MRFISHHTVRLLALFFFSCYSFSPLCVIGKGLDDWTDAPCDNSFTPAIVWVHAVIESCLDNPPDTTGTSISEKGDLFLLIRRHRAVVREYTLFPTPVPLKHAEPEGISLAQKVPVFLSRYDIPRDINHSTTISSIALNRGVSPPLLS